MTTNDSGSNTTRTILIVVGVIFGLCCLVALCGFLFLTLAGPSIGDVFSDVVRELGTPVP